MSENSIEFLDLSALDKIESVQCCRNQIKELTLNGRVLNSLVASNNSKYIYRNEIESKVRLQADCKFYGLKRHNSGTI